MVRCVYLGREFTFATPNIPVVLCIVLGMPAFMC